MNQRPETQTDLRPNNPPTTAARLARFFRRLTLTCKVRIWLGHAGVAYFRQIRDAYGDGQKVAVVFQVTFEDSRWPHVVHFNEGMQVRNFLRSLPETKWWTDHDYDDRWEGIVLEAIK